MSFYGLGLSTSSGNYSYGQQIITIRSGHEPEQLWITFQTDYGIGDSEFMDVSAVFRAIPKEKTEYNGYGDWSPESYWERIPCKNISCQENGTRYIWHVPIGIHHPSWTHDLLGDLTYNNSWEFDNRKYDAIQLDLGVDRVHSNGEKYNLSLHVNNIYILYRPYYEVYKVQHTKAGMVIYYHFYAGWNRTDDQLYVRELTATDNHGKKKAILSDAYGKVISRGQFLVPSNEIICTPEPNERIDGVFYIAPSYDPTVFYKDNRLTYGGNIQDATKCNPIRVDPIENRNRYTVDFAIREVEKYYESVDHVVVKMEPAVYSSDTITEEHLVDPTFVIVDPPLNKKVIYSITPYGKSNSTNDTLYFEVYMEASVAILTSLAHGESVFINYNYLPSFTAKPDVNIVKFAGRDRPSAFYGMGGTVEGTISGTIVDTYHPNADIPSNVETQNSGEFEIFPFYGDCVLRTPDGMRRIVSVTSIDVNAKSTNMLHVKDVSIKMTEVG